MDQRTDEEKGRNAVDILTRDLKIHGEKQGKQVTHEQAEKVAKEIAYRAEKRVEKRRK